MQHTQDVYKSYFSYLLAKTSGSDVLPLHWLVDSVLRHFKASPAGQIEGLGPVWYQRNN